MNIIFLLTPKTDVAYVYDKDTLRQVLEKMAHHRYTAIPIINQEGEYVGTLTEGDLLWV
jgi:CBS domain-containing protein